MTRACCSTPKHDAEQVLGAASRAGASFAPVETCRKYRPHPRLGVEYDLSAPAGALKASIGIYGRITRRGEHRDQRREHQRNGDATAISTGCDLLIAAKGEARRSTLNFAGRSRDAIRRGLRTGSLALAMEGAVSLHTAAAGLGVNVGIPDLVALHRGEKLAVTAADLTFGITLRSTAPAEQRRTALRAVRYHAGGVRAGTEPGHPGVELREAKARSNGTMRPSTCVRGEAVLSGC